ncbi:hypothetical protein LUCX_167 [Xanthomonas phage vB_XciM_LucasX]|nr:hypothetical protein LUCX_167 [Xanthomonas phage vB_XciM_LucasX]
MSYINAYYPDPSQQRPRMIKEELDFLAEHRAMEQAGTLTPDQQLYFQQLMAKYAELDPEEFARFENYLGSTPVALKDTPWGGMSQMERIRWMAQQYGGIDGEDHQKWLVNQILRLTYNATITACVHRWRTGEEEYHYTIGTSPEYDAYIYSLFENEEIDAQQLADLEGIAP